MDIKINRFKKVDLNESKVKAFVDLIFGGSVIVKNFKLVEGSKGLFVAMPTEKGKDDQYYSSVIVMDEETRERINTLVKDVYNKREVNI